jgi:hypothetical protein
MSVRFGQEIQEVSRLGGGLARVNEQLRTDLQKIEDRLQTLQVRL